MFILYNIHTILQYLLLGYGISTFLFLIGTLLSSSLRSHKNQYLIIANTIACIAGTLLALTMAIDLTIRGFKDENMRFDVAFVQLHLLPYSISILCLTGTALLALSKKLRQHILITLIMIFSFTLLNNPEAIIIFITSFNRDYLPSRWAYHMDYSELLTILAAIISYPVIVVLILRSKQKSLARTATG